MTSREVGSSPSSASDELFQKEGPLDLLQDLLVEDEVGLLTRLEGPSPERGDALGDRLPVEVEGDIAVREALARVHLAREAAEPRALIEADGGIVAEAHAQEGAQVEAVGDAALLNGPEGDELTEVGDELGGVAPVLRAGGQELLRQAAPDVVGPVVDEALVPRRGAGIDGDLEEVEAGC